MGYVGNPNVIIRGLTSVRRLREAGVKGMKWGQHKLKVKNPKMTTGKYPSASKTLDFMMDKGDGNYENNFSFMSPKDYSLLSSKVQGYLEKNEQKLAVLDRVSRKMSSSDTRNLAGMASSGDKSGLKSLIAKYGGDAKDAYTVMAGVHGVYDSLEQSGKINPSHNNPAIMKADYKPPPLATPNVGKDKLDTWAKQGQAAFKAFHDRGDIDALNRYRDLQNKYYDATGNELLNHKKESRTEEARTFESRLGAFLQEAELREHGVKGMKWGVHSGKSKVHPDSKGRISKKSGEPEPTHPDITNPMKALDVIGDNAINRDDYGTHNWLNHDFDGEDGIGVSPKAIDALQAKGYLDRKGRLTKKAYREMDGFGDLD